MYKGGPAPVVVGVNGSGPSAHAVRLAAREAALQNRPLRLLHAFNWIPDGPGPGGGRSRQHVEQLLDDAAHDASQVAPAVDTTVQIVEGQPVAALLHASAGAAMLVVGDGHLASRVCLPVDCPAVEIAARADCCVMVARDADEPRGPVLVGIDGTPGGDQALGFAFDTAAQHDTELVIIHVTEVEPASAEPGPAQPAAGVNQWRQKYPGVVARQQEMRGDPAGVLADESQRAELLVVGARGERPSQAALGPVSLGVLHHAPCPVVVVRGTPEVVSA
jgi:nucleotide-binding universal stress UspA family protein